MHVGRTLGEVETTIMHSTALFVLLDKQAGDMQGGSNCDGDDVVRRRGGGGGGVGGRLNGVKSRSLAASGLRRNWKCERALLGTACYMGWWLEQCELPLLNKRLVS